LTTVVASPDLVDGNHAWPKVIMMSKHHHGPAYRIETPRLVVRCMNPDDAHMFKEAVDESLDHLRPWMSWTRHEPRDINGKVERLRQLRSNFDADRDFVYGLFDPEESRMLGVSALHTRQGKEAREIAYWIHRDFTRRGLATEATAALVRVAFEVDGVIRVEIQCDPHNEPSAGIPRKLGFLHEGTLRMRGRTAEGTLRDTMIWTMFRDDYRRSVARDAVVTAYDALGQRIL
jgi:RimJ/RimL family protein N-acetyltransferase